MEVERELTCRDCDNVEIIYHCKRLGVDIKHEKKLSECHYSGNWQRGDALYIWYCSKCGSQLLAVNPPRECPECNAILGRKEVK